jgi:hypothetical protein
VIGKEEFLTPPRTLNPAGEDRVVGLEFEFAGLDIEEVTRIVAGMFGGTPAKQNDFIYQVTGTKIGDFTVEIDSAFLKEERFKEFLRAVGVNDLGEMVVGEILMRLATIAVPMEVVTPPVPLEDLSVMETLREGLKGRRALGTNASLAHAFGLHINAEAPSLAPEDILNVLRAFFVLYDWLKADAEVDPTRKILPFIDPFPEAYIRTVLNPDYHPTTRQLMGDYLAANPTRNRALDLLPLFAHIDEAFVKGRAKEAALVKPRPAYHYRLPNCRVDEPGWTVAQEWNRWVRVERLAYSGSDLKRLAQEHLSEPRTVVSWLADKLA